ncbi:MurR/RpiR family transcriptional regulator [Collimonas silvisoli]|uniref:MurR/RpiR family transcriptional regulator n=1 Tax=Collimonas silvisoli TaxID=2825884 RepID=UPI001B8BF87E|nr:MurR/RpiR family transcriptional regulator [Collimonas silvisoli]
MTTETQNQAPAIFSDLEALIRNCYPDMRPQFQAGAAFLLDNPGEVAVSTMRAIAAKAGVQPSTFVRLAQYLGFAGWADLRALFVERLAGDPKAYAFKAKNIVKRSNSDNLIAEIFAAQRANLDASEPKSADQLLAAAKTLVKAKHVHVAGFRAAFSIAFLLHYLYRLFRSSVSLVNGGAGSLELELRAIAAGDAVVVISFAPYSAEAVRVADAAKLAGSKLIALTDSVVAPFALKADHTILFSHDSPSFFPSMAAATAVAESLIELVISIDDEKAVKRLEIAERDLHRTGAYLRPNSK